MEQTLHLIESETAPFNARRFGKPWIAQVDFSESTSGQFTWGNWIGQNGEAGLLLLEAPEGAIVATGQKDYKARKYSSGPSWWQVSPDGQLIPLGTRANAYKAFKAQQQEDGK